VIYLTAGGKVPERPLTKGLANRPKIHIFRYWDIKLWETPVEELKGKHLLAVLPLCLLAEGGDQYQVAEEVFGDLVMKRTCLAWH
jgi:hypothetical protein